MGHFIEYCKECNTVIAQCRCPSKDKEVSYGICGKCKCKEKAVESAKNLQEAFNIIKKAMIDDEPSKGGSYAHSWHCNIAMSCADAIHSDESESLTWEDAHRIGNEAASRFMKLCFDVETKG